MLASLADAAQAGRLATALLGQRLRPAEVIAAAPAEAAGAVRAALGPLSGHGIRVVVTDAPSAGGSRDGVDWARPLARLASVPWLAPWPADGDGHQAAGRARTTCSTWPARGSARRRTRSAWIPERTGPP